MKKRNSAGWMLISTITATIDTENQFSNLYLFWEKEIANNTLNLYLFKVNYTNQKPFKR